MTLVAFLSRFAHVCGIAFSADSGELELIVAGGQINESTDLDVSEIFSFVTMSWREGTSLPKTLRFASTVQYGHTFYVISGGLKAGFSDEILFYDSGSWIALQQKLEKGRDNACVMEL